MPGPLQRRIFDGFIGQSVTALRVEAHMRQEAIALLERLKKELIRELALFDFDTERSDWRAARLKKFLDAANGKIDETYRLIDQNYSSDMRGLVEVSSNGVVAAFNEAVGAELLAPLNWTEETLARLTDNTLIQGAASKEWWARQSQDFQQAFSDQMRLGVMKGETLLDLRNRIVPKIDLRNPNYLNQKDFIKTARRNAEALIRTSTLTVMRKAHMDVYEANSDVIGSVQWLATLDGRTTPLCRALDGLEWTLPDYEPKGHSHKYPGPSAHWNCRSVVIPITKTWEQLAKEAGGDTRLAKELDSIEPSERASLGGPVDASVTYQEWYDGLPPWVQKDIGQSMTVDEFKAKLFHVDEAKFTDWFERMEAEYYRLKKLYNDEMTIRNNMPKENLVIDNLPPIIKKKLETNAESLIFSPDGVAKQIEHHPGMTASEYVNVLNRMKDCKDRDVIPSEGFKVVVITEGDDTYIAVLKTNAARSEVYMVSLYKSNIRQTKKWREKLKSIDIS